MVRRHGWQLPAHAFQVVAITVFFLLAIAFYVFLAPFLGSDTLEYASIALYSPVAFAVFILYVRCSAIDPSDPGIFINQGQKNFQEYEKKGVFSEESPAMTMPGTALGHSPASARGSSIGRYGKNPDNMLSSAEAGWYMPEAGKRAEVSALSCCVCGWLVKDDNCERKGNMSQAMTEEDMLFCTLCNAEVRKFSKHCRSCDKCVDGFDHHCRWLNNCVGKKNYITFVLLMATSLILLILEWGMGTAVLVQCFVNKRGTESQIVNKLGDSFSRAPFAAVVASCTLVSLLASLPLGELFFFHIILIRKGITTYEYVVAMRAQSEAQGASADGDHLSVPSSPTSSTATGLSVSSSLGLQYRGAWCTPPRIFVDQDEIIPQLGPGKLPSTVDPDSIRRDALSQKRTVKISAWKLARLNPEEAAKAVMKARASSSILRPVGSKVGQTEYASSNVSSRSSMSNDLSFIYGKRHVPGLPSSKFSVVKGGEDLRSRSSYSSPSCSMNGSGMLSPLPLEHKYGPCTRSHVVSKCHWLVNDGYEASGGESADDRSSEHLRNAVEKAGAGVQVTGAKQAWANPSPSLSSVSDGPAGSIVQPTNEKLLYSGTSIFYGGPISMPRIDREASNAEAKDSGATKLMIQDPRSAVARAAFARSQSPIFAPRQQQQQ